MQIEDINSVRANDRDELGIRFNNRSIAIPIRFSGLDITLTQLLERLEYLENKVRDLESENESKVLRLNDTQAQAMIVGHIRLKKGEGVKTLDALDIYDELKLPFDQINRIMVVLKARGVNETDD